MSASPSSAAPEGILPHLSLGSPEASSTVVLIHGAQTTPRCWLPVGRILEQKYHILIPALPGHSAAQVDFPHLTVESTSDNLRDLILSHAINQRAHIVGHSLGAHVAIHFVSQNPSLVDTVYLSGLASLSTGKVARALIPYGYWAVTRLEGILPISCQRWALGLPPSSTADDVEWLKRFPDPCTSMQLSCEIIKVILSTQPASLEMAIAAKTLVVAATKSVGPFPADDIEVAKALVKLLCSANDRSKGAVLPSLSHPWNEQDPDLFARSIETWIQEGSVLPGFQQLD